MATIFRRLQRLLSQYEFEDICSIPLYGAIVCGLSDLLQSHPGLPRNGRSCFCVVLRSNFKVSMIGRSEHYVQCWMSVAASQNLLQSSTKRGMVRDFSHRKDDARDQKNHERRNFPEYGIKENECIRCSKRTECLKWANPLYPSERYHNL